MAVSIKAQARQRTANLASAIRRDPFRTKSSYHNKNVGKLQPSHEQTRIVPIKKKLIVLLLVIHVFIALLPHVANGSALSPSSFSVPGSSVSFQVPARRVSRFGTLEKAFQSWLNHSQSFIRWYSARKKGVDFSDWSGSGGWNSYSTSTANTSVK